MLRGHCHKILNRFWTRVAAFSFRIRLPRWYSQPCFQKILCIYTFLWYIPIFKYSQWVQILKHSAAAAKSLQSCPTLCDPIDGSPPGSPVPGILQARTLEWVAISFSNAWKWKVKVKPLSHVRLLATPRTAAYQAPPSMGFFQARVLEWGAIAFSKNVANGTQLQANWPKNRQHISTLWIISVNFLNLKTWSCELFAATWPIPLSSEWGKSHTK